MNIVQIGANRGNDDLTQIIGKIKPDKFIIVEPMAIHNEFIKKCYDWIDIKIIENLAITPEKIDTIEFYYHKDDGPEYQVASTDKNHILKHRYSESGIETILVSGITLNDLLKKHSIIELDVLFIDAEGLDEDIIKSINFEEFKINKIYFENLHLKTDINFYLKNKGYDITTGIGSNGWMNLASLI